MLLYLFLILNVLNFVDGFLTISVVSSGLAREGNPLMAFLLDKGPSCFMSIKMAVCFAGTTFMYLAGTKEDADLKSENLIKKVFIGLVVLYSFVVISNLIVFLQINYG